MERNKALSKPIERKKKAGDINQKLLEDVIENKKQPNTVQRFPSKELARFP